MLPKKSIARRKMWLMSIIVLKFNNIEKLSLHYQIE